MSYRNPILYTEDGVWLGMLMEHGFRYTFFNARGDYFVAINIIILAIANELNSALFNGSLLSYPAILAILIDFWYAFVVTLPAILFFQLLPLWGWVTFVVCLALLPFGNTSYEILARASNVGFSAFYVAFCCVTYRWLTSKRAQVKTWCIDISIVICLLTNPLVLGLYPVLYWSSLKAWWSGVSVKTIIKEDYSLYVLLMITVFVVISLAYRYQSAPLIGAALARRSPVEFNHVFTYLVGRSFLYPFVSAVYSHLNNFIVIFASIVVFVPVYLCFRVDKKIGSLSLMLFFYWLFIAIATIALRPGLLEMFSSYKSTNPDRYVLLQNMLALTAVLLVFLRHLSNVQWRTFSSLSLVLFVGVYIIQSVFLSWREHARPPYETYLGSQLQLELSAAENSQANDFASMPIYFLGWSMRVRFENLKKLSDCCSHVLSISSEADINRDIEKVEGFWRVVGPDPMSYWIFKKPIASNEIPIFKFYFSCINPTQDYSDIGVYWLDSSGNASGDRAFLFKAKPGWQVVPMDEITNYTGAVGGFRLDLESRDSCKSYSFDRLDFFKWLSGIRPTVPRLVMPWANN